MTATAIGIDLGGTNLRVALVDVSGNRIAERFEAIADGADGDAILGQVIAAVVDVAATRVTAAARSDAPIGLGLAVAGALDEHDCLIAGMTNLPVLAGVPLADRLRAATGFGVRIENDARAAMLGEARFGAAHGVQNALILTLGTGIGGGLMLDGRLRRGPRHMAGEIGLSLAPKPTGGYEPLEDAASPGGLKRTRGLDLEHVAARAAAGDVAAAAEIDRVHELLAAAIVDAHVTLDLERVLLAGGMTRAGAQLRDAVQHAFVRLAPPAFRDTLRIELAALGAWSGAMGAAALWLDEADGKTQ